MGAEHHAVGTWLFLRGLGLCHVIAFTSLGVQVVGLVGSRGILPACQWLDTLQVHGSRRWALLPTLFWLRCSDRALRSACVLGAAAGALLALGVLPHVMLLACWALYLSLLQVCGRFLGYQWDVLLLEASVVGLLAAPLQAMPSWPPVAVAPPAIGWWLSAWLAFRLVLSSGLVKLRSGDPAWRGLTAMEVHYETQPLPNPLSWLAHHQPRWAHRAAAAGTIGIELAAPVAFLLPYPCPEVGVALTAALMAGIALTGNYGFFNLLTCVITLPLLDDRWLAPLLGIAVSAPPAASSVAHAAVTVPVALLLIALSAERVLPLLGVPLAWPRPVERVLDSVRSLHLVSGYGLFAVMTTTRPEIVVEASDDGATWRELPFRWKPTDPRRRPPWAGLHVPRLDWQAWFAALGPRRPESWFVAFLARLLEGSPAVERLLAPEATASRDAPPRMLRATLYRYRFTSRAERRATGAWWTRELLGTYCPPLRAGR